MEVNKMEFETFYDEIKDINGVLRLTIPDKLVKFAGFKASDKVKVMIQKAPEEVKQPEEKKEEV